MRRLLVASQKGGVGKTTTSMNLAAATALCGTRVLLLDADPLSNISTALHLAEHPQRRPLRQAGIDLPGALIANLIPGLDVLNAYDEGPCTDQDFARLLQVLATPSATQCYGCVILDVPPFFGGSAATLLSCCDEFLLVMRAEATAHRTMPAFLELVHRSSPEGHPVPMCGILLTLPEGEEPGCRLERELRGRFGTRVLPEVIPHDESIVADLSAGHIGSHLHPDAPASRQYHQLVSKLGLAAESGPRVEVERILQALGEASEQIGASIEARGESGEERELSDESSTFAPRPSPSSPRATPTHRRLARSERGSASAAETAFISTRSVRARDAQALAQLWPLWILLGAVLGGGLRLAPLPPSLFPFLIGLGAALLVVVVLFTVAPQNRTKSSGAEKRRNWLRRRESKKNPPRSETRQEHISARLASLASFPKHKRSDADSN